MRRFLHYSSAFVCAILLIYTVGLGVYQAQELAAFVPNASEHWQNYCRPGSDAAIYSGMCSEYNDRFWSIAFGAIVPLILFPAIPVFLATRKVPPSGKRTALISVLALAIMLVVPLSGIGLYYTLGR